MSNYKKTLADVQPGGRVRLGDGFGPSEVWVNVYSTGAFREANDTRARVGADGVGTVLRYVRDDLSAQPSPGGQEALREAAEFARRVLAEIYATYQVKIGPFASQAQLANVKLGAALAARQPVGEPVAYWLAVDKDGIVEFGMSADDGNEGQAARQEVNDFINGALHDGGVPHRLVGVYTAPPAQAVDLVQFRALAEFGEEFAFSAEKQPQSRVIYAQARRLLALIDSQAVGNG
ncbi:hypothetical protein [Stenotrophomonas thermophila]|nr:hypothetical protein BN126340097 [Stenotrophomonas maltophilia]